MQDFYFDYAKSVFFPKNTDIDISKKKRNSRAVPPVFWSGATCKSAAKES
jgi:hypothetical protein